jgi:murein DD-endopeptidase MepM/ murein hydrolase activator NlpD
MPPARLPAAAACAVLFAALGATASPAKAVHIGLPSDPVALAAKDSPGAACDEGMLPDGDVCVHLPSSNDEGLEAEPIANAHRERSGRWAIYDQIPRRPDRPADYDVYRYPIPPGLPGGHHVVSGYDLDKPDPSQRRGRSLRAVGHGGVDLPQKKGTEVRLVGLDHQQGEADVVYTGHLFGTTVVMRHTVREAGQLRDYLVLFGHLDAVAPGLVRGAHVRDGELVGFVGDTGSPELVHLHLEVRRVRDGLDVQKVEIGRLLEGSVSIVTDPRNVLPLL